MSNTDNGLQASLYFYFYLLSTADSIIEPPRIPVLESLHYAIFIIKMHPGNGKPTLRAF